MFTLLKRSLYILSNALRRQRQPVELMKEKWIADFSKLEKSCFDIKPEISYNAYLAKSPGSKEGSLFLGLRKKNCMAWLETANRVYVDQVIEARLRFNGPGAYCAAGIMFRVYGQGTYYLALISNKGYFRLDAVNNNIPSPLVGWTEISNLNLRQANLGIIARGDHIIFVFNGKWIAEVYDASIPGGHLGLALVSYETDISDQSEKSNEAMYFPPEMQSSTATESYTCHVWLDYLSVDSRAIAVETEYQKWCDNMKISAESRLRLAESLASLDHFDAAYNQILRAWKQREKAAQSVSATYTETRAREELLFAAQMASRIGQYAKAEEYVNACLAMDMNTVEGLDALAEKAKILSVQNRHNDLVAFLPDYIKLMDAAPSLDDVTRRPDIPSLYALLGHAFWNLRDYKAAVAAWDTAFDLKKNGLYAANAANAYEMMGKKKDAVRRRLDAGNCFMQQEDYTELGTLIPKLLAIANNNWEAHALAGKWASGIGNVEQAKTELALANKLKRKVKPVKAQTKATGGKAQAHALNKKQPVKTKTKPAMKPVQKTAAKQKSKTSSRKGSL
jgi:tetratricopeptide (TPR) repeat protein